MKHKDNSGNNLYYNTYSDNSVGDGNINWTQIFSTSDFERFIYKSPTEKMKEDIFNVLEKIKDGGKKQIIFSLKSNDELEREVAKAIMDMVVAWQKDEKC